MTKRRKSRNYGRSHRTRGRRPHQRAPLTKKKKPSLGATLIKILTLGIVRPKEDPPRKNEKQQARPKSNGLVRVTSGRLYVGNIAYSATEEDLQGLFKGVGQVKSVEIVTYKHNQRSKGFAFVEMQTLKEAKRAVSELHHQSFMGRKLIVNGAKSKPPLRD